MRKNMMLACVLMAMMTPAIGAQPAADDALIKAAQAALRGKIKLSGTLDLYDDKIKAVRNLQTIEIHKETAAAEGGKAVTADFRDINNGDVVTVEIVVSEKGEALSASDPVIKSVKPLKTDFEKQYTQDDIRAYMKDQLAAQAKFSGYVSLFDPDKEKMRKLELIELSSEIRKLGVLNISRTRFKDLDSGETLGVDVTVENRNAQLSLQALRIRQVTKGE